MKATKKQFNWYLILPPTILSFITAIVYYPSLYYDFQFDDVANITKHFDIRHYSFRGLFFSGTRWISYWLNSLHYKIGKFNPFSYRVANVGLHITNGLILFIILYKALSNLKKESFFSRHALQLASITSALFLLHPVQTQTISYVIQGQLEGLAAFAILSMILCLLIAAQSTHTIKRSIAIVLLFFFTLFAVGTKEIAIVSPVLLLLFDWFFIAQGNKNELKTRWWMHAFVFALLTSLYVYLLKPKIFFDILGLNYLAKNNIGNVLTRDPKAAITPLHFFISQFKVLVHYLWIYVWPFGISVEYDWMLSDSFFALDSFFPFLLLATLGFGVYKLLRANSIHPIAFCAFWFAIAHAPRSTIIPSSELLADYKTYLPSIGWLFVIATLLLLTWQKALHAFTKLKKIHQLKGAQIALPLILLVPVCAATLKRNTIWSSSLDFWGNMIKNAPGKARAYNNYGVELSQKFKKWKESIPYFKKAIAMDRNYPDPWNNLAVAHAQLKDMESAANAMRGGLKINPYYPEGYNNLAAIYLENKNFDKAEEVLAVALKLRPYYGKAFYNLGRVYLQTDRPEMACEAFRKCCTQGDLDNETGYSAFARSCLSLEKYDDAIFAFTKLVEINPHNRAALYNLGNCYFLTKKYESAIDIYKKLHALNPKDARTLYNLGESYYNLNKLDESLAYFNKAQERNPRDAKIKLRVAACLEKKGQVNHSYKLIKEIIADRAAPQEAKNIATELVKQFKIKYQLS